MNTNRILHSSKDFAMGYRKFLVIPNSKAIDMQVVVKEELSDNWLCRGVEFLGRTNSLVVP